MRLHTPRFVLAVAANLVSISLLIFAIVARAQTDGRAPVPKRKWAYNALAKVPAPMHERNNPLEGDPDAVAAGRKLYTRHCLECHGQNAGGTRRGPNLRAAATKDGSPGDLFFILTNGVVRHGMPAWSKLPSLERWQIVSYLKTLHE